MVESAPVENTAEAPSTQVESNPTANKPTGEPDEEQKVDDSLPQVEAAVTGVTPLQKQETGAMPQN